MSDDTVKMSGADKAAAQGAPADIETKREGDMFETALFGYSREAVSSFLSDLMAETKKKEAGYLRTIDQLGKKNGELTQKLTESEARAGDLDAKYKSELNLNQGHLDINAKQKSRIQDLDRRIAGALSDSASWKEKFDDSIARTDKAEKELGETSARLQELETRMQETKSGYAQEIERLTTENSENSQTLRVEYEGKLREAAAKAKEERDGIETNCAAQLQQLKDEHRVELQRVSASQAAQLQELRDAQTAELEKLRVELSAQLAQREEQYNRTLAEKQSEAESMQTRFQDELSKMHVTYKEEMARVSAASRDEAGKVVAAAKEEATRAVSAAREEITRVLAARQEELRRATESSAAEAEAARQETARVAQACREEIEKAQTAYKEQLDRLNESRREEQAKAAAYFNAQTEGLRTAYAELKKKYEEDVANSGNTRQTIEDLQRQLAARQAEWQGALAQKDAEAKNLLAQREAQLRDASQRADLSTGRLNEALEKLTAVMRTLEDRNRQLEESGAVVSALEQKAAEKENELAARVEDCRRFSRALAERDAALSEKAAQLSARDGDIAERDRQLAEAKTAVQSAQDRSEKLTQVLADREHLLAEKESELSEKAIELSEKAMVISGMDRASGDKDAQLRQLQEELSAKDNELELRREAEKAQQKKISEIEQLNADMFAQFEDYRQKVGRARPAQPYAQPQAYAGAQMPAQQRTAQTPQAAPAQPQTYAAAQTSAQQTAQRNSFEKIYANRIGPAFQNYPQPPRPYGPMPQQGMQQPVPQQAMPYAQPPYDPRFFQPRPAQEQSPAAGETGKAE
ncbi:MAG: hypothetical protein VB021_02625 [Oscillospiraceae bacterium]|nr:hypothetical protein [Oscillospiraceae bacterium]